MKDYPSIPGSTGQNFREIRGCYVFDKLDGSSMRSEWSRKAGWYKHGRRKGLLDDSNESIVAAEELFMETLAEVLERITRKNRWARLTVFYEFWGKKSLAGLHVVEDPKRLTLFGAMPNNKTLCTPQDFRKAFEGKVETTAFLGIHNWTRGFVERVHAGDLDGITFEGVVGTAPKKDKKDRLIQAKAKTRAWKDRIKEMHGANAERILNS